MIRAAIGIDPGATTGIAFLRGDMRLRSLKSFAWKKYGAHGIYLIVCATAKTLNPQPRESVVIGIELPTGGSYNRDAAQRWSYARGLGANIERAQELIRLFRADGWTVIEIAPRQSWTKWKRDEFNSYFDWGGRSNEHTRDAALHAVRALAKARAE